MALKSINSTQLHILENNFLLVDFEWIILLLARLMLVNFDEHELNWNR